MIEVKNVSKFYEDELGNKIKLFEDISFSAGEHSFSSIVAPSGSGKSTLAKILCKIESYNSGEINISENLKVFYIPSPPSSLPWLNVSDNVKVGNQNISADSLTAALRIVELDGYENHFPENNSLGFRLRIMLARAIAGKYRLIVMDEPFSQMDEQTKGEMYLLIRKIFNTTDISFLLTTTNISEAIFLSTKILLMKKNLGSIFESILVDLAKERSLNDISSEKFFEIRTDIEKAFKKIDTQKFYNISI